MFKVGDIVVDKMDNSKYKIDKECNHIYTLTGIDGKSYGTLHKNTANILFTLYKPYTCDPCSHDKVVDVGFRFSKYVCYHCNKEVG